MVKLAFMGSSLFSVPSLQKLIESKHEIVALYCQSPKPAGRGKKESKCPTHLIANQYNIPVYTPKSFRDAQTQEEFKKLGCDIVVVVAYGLILPKEILIAPKCGCINLHPSDLPKFRGAAPIQRTILSGEKNTAICIIQMDEGLDTGDILLKKFFTLEENITSGMWHDRAAKNGAQMIIEVIDNLNNLSPIKQSQENITYANKITKEEAIIDFTKSAQEIDRKIRGLNPWPIAYFQYMGENIKIFEAEIINMQGMAGEVLDDKLTIACGSNAIRPKLLQRPSKNIVSCDDFLRGYNIKPGFNLNDKI